jgi:hypothetical protein
MSSLLASPDSLVGGVQALGHSRIQVTLDMYSHADPELAKGSAERFAALIDG